MRIAVLSDIHGNRPALEAVLSDIERKQVDAILNLGDSLYGPLDPAGTADILIGSRILSIAGNEDRIVLVREADEARAPSLSYTRECLSESHRAWLSALPETATYRDQMLLCHGTPECDSEYLLEQVTEHGVGLREEADINALLATVKEEVVLCGHSHCPRTVRLPSGRLVVNPGSVGLQAYTDDSPFPHEMETGSPHARYGILSMTSGEWKVQHILIEYAHDEAADLALKNGRADWACWLRTGRARA